MLKCYNRGCGKSYDPEKNTSDSCLHHPGVPFFHDAYKGWTCCNKKSVDFTEFLNIKGCTLSKHSNIKPVEPESPHKTDKTEVVEVRQPIRKALERTAVDAPMTKLHTNVAPALREYLDQLIAHKSISVCSSQVENGVIAIGTACKNSACTYSYTGTAADERECQYHPGVPIFHEGMKYWSCCQKRTTDFTVFMSQKGCAYGSHKWLKDKNEENTVKCRYDWHQTATNVIVTIYAKKYNCDRSLIEVNPVRLHCQLVFPEENNAIFELDIELRGMIKVETSTAHMYTSKVEITLTKAEPGLWQKLDIPCEKLPPVRKCNDPTDTTIVASKDIADSEEEFNLDDIETLNAGFRLAEIDRK